MLRRRQSLPALRRRISPSASRCRIRPSAWREGHGGSSGRRGRAQGRPGGAICALHRDQGDVRRRGLYRSSSHVSHAAGDETVNLRSSGPGRRPGECGSTPLTNSGVLVARTRRVDDRADRDQISRSCAARSSIGGDLVQRRRTKADIAWPKSRRGRHCVRSLGAGSLGAGECLVAAGAVRRESQRLVRSYVRS